jgi:hypothetical protein
METPHLQPLRMALDLYFLQLVYQVEHIIYRSNTFPNADLANTCLSEFRP